MSTMVLTQSSGKYDRHWPMFSADRVLSESFAGASIGVSTGVSESDGVSDCSRKTRRGPECPFPSILLPV